MGILIWRLSFSNSHMRVPPSQTIFATDSAGGITAFMRLTMVATPGPVGQAQRGSHHQHRLAEHHPRPKCSAPPPSTRLAKAAGRSGNRAGREACASASCFRAIRHSSSNRCRHGGGARLLARVPENNLDRSRFRRRDAFVCDAVSRPGYANWPGTPRSSPVARPLHTASLGLICPKPGFASIACAAMASIDFLPLPAAPAFLAKQQSLPAAILRCAAASREVRRRSPSA